MALQDDPNRRHGDGYIPPPGKYEPRFHRTSFLDDKDMQESIEKFAVTESSRKSAVERGSHGGGYTPNTDGGNPKA